MKKLIAFFFALIFTFPLFAQKTTYSKAEERMAQYANNQYALAFLNDSSANAAKALDSCARFLAKYPNSFAKPNVLIYMLKLNFLITKDKSVIFPLIDSVFYYDSLPGTKEEIGGELIEKNVDIERGEKLIKEVLQIITDTFHIYRCNLLLADAEKLRNNFHAADSYYKTALKILPSVKPGWMGYLGFLTMTGNKTEAARIRAEIEELEKDPEFTKISCAYVPKNINKSIELLKLNDAENKPFDFGSVKGKVCAVVYFNYWYGYYVKDFPIIEKISKDFPGVEFVFIQYGNPAKELSENLFSQPEYSFVKKHKILLGVNEILPSQGFASCPRIVLTNKRGIIKYDYETRNGISEQIIRLKLEKLVSE
jgi:tetratricopeptide (TPR) repeat protein